MKWNNESVAGVSPSHVCSAAMKMSGKTPPSINRFSHDKLIMNICLLCLHEHLNKLQNLIIIDVHIRLPGVVPHVRCTLIPVQTDVADLITIHDFAIWFQTLKETDRWCTGVVSDLNFYCSFHTIVGLKRTCVNYVVCLHFFSN